MDDEDEKARKEYNKFIIKVKFLNSFDSKVENLMDLGGVKHTCYTKMNVIIIMIQLICNINFLSNNIRK